MVSFTFLRSLLFFFSLVYYGLLLCSFSFSLAFGEHCHSQVMFWVRTKMPISVGSVFGCIFFCSICIIRFQLHCGSFTAFRWTIFDSVYKFLFPLRSYSYNFCISNYATLIPQIRCSMPHRMTVECWNMHVCLCAFFLFVVLIADSRIASIERIRSTYGLSTKWEHIINGEHRHGEIWDSNEIAIHIFCDIAPIVDLLQSTELVIYLLASVFTVHTTPIDRPTVLRIFKVDASDEHIIMPSNVYSLTLQFIISMCFIASTDLHACFHAVKIIRFYCQPLWLIRWQEGYFRYVNIFRILCICDLFH